MSYRINVALSVGHRQIKYINLCLVVFMGHNQSAAVSEIIKVIRIHYKSLLTELFYMKTENELILSYDVLH